MNTLTATAILVRKLNFCPLYITFVVYGKPWITLNDQRIIQYHWQSILQRQLSIPLKPVHVQTPVAWSVDRHITVLCAPEAHSTRIQWHLNHRCMGSRFFLNYRMETIICENIHLLISMELNSIQMHPFKVHACTVLCRVGEVMGSRIIWMHLELCTSCTWIYYIYMVCIRVEPAIFEKKGNYRRGSRGDRGSGSLELSKYTSQRTTFQDFRCYQGVTLYAYFKIFRPHPFRLLSHLTRMKVHVLWSVTTVQRFCRLPWKFQGCASFIYFLHTNYIYL